MPRLIRCTATTSRGTPCKAWAIPDTDPPLCAAHGGAQKKPGAPPGNDNARKHGFYASRPQDKPLTIETIIDDLADKQHTISELIDAQGLDAEIPELVKLLAIHGQNASRLGRLLRDQRALSGEAADGIAGAIAQALEELGTELGVSLVEEGLQL